MPVTYDSYRTFIASPSDVARERELAEDTIARINRSLRDTLRIGIEVRKWEHRPPITPSLPKERLQDRLLEEVAQSHFFILILGKRYGQVEPGHTISNTEREIEAILAQYQKTPKLQILAYFLQLPDNKDIGEQERKVRDLRRRLENLGLVYRTYSTPEDFKDQFTHDLYEIALKIRLSPYKKQILNSFWQFGDLGRPHVTRVAIVFPPFQRQSIREGSSKDFWLQRLTAPLAFEDYKAIQKIEKHFQLLGLRDYRLFPCTDSPSDLDQMNRIWLCVPRNRPALKALSETSGLRFRFAASDKARPRHLVWRTSGGKEIKITSPLTEYIQLQRSRMAIDGEWHGALGRLVAKDFAVVARVSRNVGDVDGDGPLRDFYFAGVRGLGTWGAAWFIDREYSALKRFDPTENIERLLEVTFRSGRILSVRDVSDEPAAYFRTAVRSKTVEREVSRLFEG